MKVIDLGNKKDSKNINATPENKGSTVYKKPLLLKDFCINFFTSFTLIIDLEFFLMVGFLVCPFFVCFDFIEINAKFFVLCINYTLLTH